MTEMKGGNLSQDLLGFSHQGHPEHDDIGEVSGAHGEAAGG